MVHTISIGSCLHVLERLGVAGRSAGAIGGSGDAGELQEIGCSIGAWSRSRSKCDSGASRTLLDRSSTVDRVSGAVRDVNGVVVSEYCDDCVFQSGIDIKLHSL